MQTQTVSSLPDRWVERIWATMRATYGASFDRQWECPAGVDPVEHVQEMKAHWGRELSRLQQNPQAIAYALDNLPDFPPNLVQFRAVCNRAPVFQAPKLAAPAPDPERLGKELQRLSAVASKAPYFDHKAWAHRLKAREESGEKLSAYQRQCWREALNQQNQPEETTCN